MQYSSLLKNNSTNISEFIEQKNQEIRNLKNKILGSRVTYDDMQTAKSRLDNLRLAQTQLEKEDYMELKQVIKSCSHTINELSQKRASLQSKLQDEQRDSQEMQTLQSQLNLKKQKMTKVLHDLKDQELKIKGKKQKKNCQILEMEEEITKRKKEVNIERAIQDQLAAANQELDSKKEKSQAQLLQIQKDNLKLREQIKEQMLKITNLQHNYDQISLKAQLVQEQISHHETKSALLHHKIQYSQEFLQAYAQNKLVLLSERDTTANIESLIKICTQSYEKKQMQQRKCEEQIEILMAKIQESKNRKNKAEQEVKTKKEAVKELKDKGVELKGILNSIFMEDSTVLKMIADKKVFEEVDTNSEVSIKKNSAKTGSKVEYFKKDMLDSMETSDNFFLTKNSSTTY